MHDHIEETVRAARQQELQAGFRQWSDAPPATSSALGGARWDRDLILATWYQAEHGTVPPDREYRTGSSGGGFDTLSFRRQIDPTASVSSVDIGLEVNQREDTRIDLSLDQPFYGGGMSLGSISGTAMEARARAASRSGTLTGTGEGGYPDELVPYADHIITQVATGMFGVHEDTIERAPMVEFKYAQGAKPGLGGHLLAEKVTDKVASMRDVVPDRSLFSPFPFHSVYSVEDHKKHLDWVKTVNEDGLVSVKIATPHDVGMVAVGSYYAGAHVIHLDGGYGGTGAAPDIAKKNIAMPIEYAIPRVHRTLQEEGVRDEVTVIASGGIRTAYDMAKAIALGADGCVIGTADLVALGWTKTGRYTHEQAGPFGITTADPDGAAVLDPAWGADRIARLYSSYNDQLRRILDAHDLGSIQELRGRTELLRRGVPDDG